MCVVITKDVSEDDSFGLFTLHSICRNLIQLFFFQCGKEALHTSVVIAVSSTAEALDEPICYKLPAEGVACVLAATVVVKDSSFESAVLLTKLFYGVNTEFFLHVVMHFKSNYLSVEAVEDGRNIELSVCRLDLGNICQQFLQWFVCTEFSLDQILSVLSFSISLCDAMRSAAPVNKPGFAHSAVYRPEADMSALLRKSCLVPGLT